MQQFAVVKKLLPNQQAELEVQRQTACGHDCSKCGGCGEMISAPIVVTADNSIGAQIGEVVRIEGSTKQVLGLAAALYVVPFVLFFVLYGIAAALQLSYPGVWAVVGFAIGIFFAKKVNDRQAKTKPVYTISRLTNHQ